MKKIILAAVAASVVAAPVAAAPFDRHDNRSRSVYVQGNQKVTVVNKRNGRQLVKVKHNNRRWNRGQRFDRRQARNYRVINDYRAYRLQAPPRGYRYVQSDNDVVMVAIASGLIGAVFANIF
jgi:Ni/Co efflux regulator RcnB